MPDQSQDQTFTPISDLGEFALIDRIDAILGRSGDDRLIAGISDDAAVYRVGDGLVHVVTSDALLEGVHFDRFFMPMLHLGIKAVSVNVSDVVAMNARPRYATVVLGLPNNISVEMVEAFYHGIKKACAAYGLTIIGGDTTGARWLTVSVTVIGEAREEDVVYRSGARPGDLLCATGDLGAAYAGLQVLLGQRKAYQEQAAHFQPALEPYSYVIQRQLTPTAQLKIIEDWAERGVRPSALIDVSDGVASEVHHLCQRSNCGALVHAAALPIAVETRDAADELGADVDTFALFGGEDYELLFAISEEDADRLDRETFNVIGRFTRPEEGIRVQAPEGDVISLDAAGYQHFDNGEK